MTTLIPKDMLVNKVSKQSGLDSAIVKEVFSCLESTIFDCLTQTNSSTDVHVKLFDGISFQCKYIPESTVPHPESREPIVVKPKIWTRAKITRNYNRKLNMQASMNREEMANK